MILILFQMELVQLVKDVPQGPSDFALPVGLKEGKKSF